MVRAEEVFKRCSICVFVAVCFVVLCGVSVANAAEEWVEIPVIVNVLKGADGNNIGKAIDNANEIFKQAKIKLVVKKTNNDVNVVNNDASLTEAEGDKAQEEGQKELDKTFTDPNGKWNGKGVKITVGDDCWVGEPNTIGWAVHRIPVVVVEDTDDVNSVGSTIVHELIHALTVEDHSDDPNDVMYPTDEGGTLIDPNDVNEITPEAKKRGTAYMIKLEPAASGTVAPGRIEYSVDAYGAILDGFHDVQVTPPTPPFHDPNEPTIQYADVREVTMFADKPFGPGGVWRFEIHRGGLIPEWPTQSTFNMAFEYDSILPGPEVQMHIQLINQAGQAMVQNLHTGMSMTLPVIVHRNDKFDGSVVVPKNHSLEVDIPIEILPMPLMGLEPAPIEVFCDLYITIDSRDSFFPRQIIDSVVPFKVRLSNCPKETIHVQNVDGLYIIKGHDFVPNTVQTIYIDGVSAGSTKADDWGRFWTPIPPLVTVGEPVFITLSAPNSGQTQTAAAVLSYCPQGHSLADLDGDCDVDLTDFAKFAHDWLHGK